MRRLLVVNLLATCSGVAHASGKHESWKAVEKLGHGVPVEVQLRGEAGTDICRVVSADDNALTVRGAEPRCRLGRNLRSASGLSTERGTERVVPDDKQPAHRGVDPHRRGRWARHRRVRGG